MHCPVQITFTATDLENVHVLLHLQLFRSSQPIPVNQVSRCIHACVRACVRVCVQVWHRGVRVLCERATAGVPVCVRIRALVYHVRGREYYVTHSFARGGFSHNASTASNRCHDAVDLPVATNRSSSDVPRVLAVMVPDLTADGSS